MPSKTAYESCIKLIISYLSEKCTEPRPKKFQHFIHQPFLLYFIIKILACQAVFADEHNSAFFVCGNDLVMIDCPTTSFQKIKKMKELAEFENIFILVTYTHGDHSSGISTILQYAYFVLNKKVAVVTTSE